MMISQKLQHDPILSPADASKLIGVSKSTFIRHWQRRLPVLRLSPGRIGFRRSDLLAALEARCEGGS
jgi:hypothetical protein